MENHQLVEFVSTTSITIVCNHIIVNGNDTIFDVAK